MSSATPRRPQSPVPSTLAVIGLDPTGLGLARAVMAHPDATLAVVADPDAERGAATARLLAIPFAPNYLDVLDDPTLDGLIVTGDPAGRATILAEAAVRGRALLTLLPPTTTAARLDDLILTAAQGGGRVTCANPLRLFPATAEAARLLRDKALGQPLALFASVRTKPAPGDALAELGLPLLDYLVWLVRSEVATIQATAASLFGGKEPDTWLLILHFRSGLVATVELARSLPLAFPTATETRIEFLGTEHAVVAEPDNLSITIHAADGATRRDPCGPDVAHALLDEFLPTLRDGAASEQSLVNLRWVMPLIEAARISAAHGDPVAIGRR